MKTDKLIQLVITELEKRYELIPKRTIEDPNAFIAFFNFVCDFVASDLNITPENIVSGKQDGSLVEARDYCIYLCDKYYKGVMTTDLLASLIGKHRTTVVGTRSRLRIRLETDKFYKQRFDLLEQNFLLKYNEEKFNLEQTNKK